MKNSMKHGKNIKMNMNLHIHLDNNNQTPTKPVVMICISNKNKPTGMCADGNDSFFLFCIYHND